MNIPSEVIIIDATALKNASIGELQPQNGHKNNKLDKVCPICQNGFIYSRNARIYCSKECAKKGKKLYCKKEYQMHRNHYLNLARNQRKLHPDYMKKYWECHKLKRKENSKNHRLKIKNMQYIGKDNIAKNLRRNLRKLLLGHNNLAALKLLGCSYDYFIKYYQSLFTSDMSWDKVMNGEIHCDHIRPCASFDLNNLKDQETCFHYTNLQPLWAKDNLKKGKSYGKS